MNEITEEQVIEVIKNHLRTHEVFTFETEYPVINMSIGSYIRHEYTGEINITLKLIPKTK